MRVDNNHQEYQKAEIALLEALVSTLRIELEEAGLKGRKLKAATSDLAFAIAEMLDGEKVIPLPAGMTPAIAFLKGTNSELLVSESTLHERVFGCVDAEFARSTQNLSDLKAWMKNDLMAPWGTEGFSTEDRLLAFTPRFVSEGILTQEDLRRLIDQLEALSKMNEREIQRVLHAATPEHGKQRLVNLQRAFIEALQ
jgi:hypothetical protein